MKVGTHLVHASLGCEAIAYSRRATLHSPRRRVPGHASGIAEFQPTRLCPAVTLPCLKVWAEPVRPEASCPCVGIEHAQSENTPLFRAPCCVEPKRLTKDPENTRPSLPAFTRVLRKPDRDEATEGDADLIQAKQVSFQTRTTSTTLQ